MTTPAGGRRVWLITSYVGTGGGAQAGDPAKAARAILTAMASAKPPRRLVLGRATAIDG